MNRRFFLAASIACATLSAVPAYARAPFASDRIIVEARGKGPDVILIPGLSSAPRMWESTVAALPGYRYHLVHVRGFAGVPAGGNARGDVAAGVAEEIARYIDDAKLKRPAVIGHSMGGTIGMMIAARHPASLSRLMVVDMLPFMGALFGPPGTTAESVRPIADQIAAGLKASTGDARRARIVQTIGGMIRTESERPAAVEEGVKSDPDVAARSFRELIVTDLRPELPHVTVPTTILYVTPGGVPLSDAQVDGFYKFSFAGLKGAKLVRVPDSAHFIMFDNPARFRSEMRAFLE
ncbi:alpha/beta hydrolase [Sphingomonas oleivorans]|uniref:Alpha/beta hydrolase n=1 Tax=Sphingomonas oleivorans TaxID=1735121 RepID=A0A2T5FXA6_9SPHN|nr:alpha/beta hydrolase [Sphingomonas oleivorans]PTQ10763.1 alpha/beta hydrolase [Sphingomonas oleivorans]